MSFEWSEIAIRRDYGEYGVAFNSSSLHLVTLSTDEGGLFVIGSFTKPEHFPLSYFETLVAGVEDRARHIAARETLDRFVDEVAAYVRPRLAPPPEPADADDFQRAWECALSDIQDGLRAALPETDAYRAARNLEINVRGLSADIEIIDLMEPILTAFNADTNKRFGAWVEKAAAAEQRLIENRSEFVEAAIRKLQDSESGLAAARP